MDTQFRCRNEERRSKVQLQKLLNGIDYLEVSADQRTLNVFFIHPLPAQIGQVPPAPATELSIANIRIEGGVHTKGIRATKVKTEGNILRVTVDQPGDFSFYTLRLVTSTTSDKTPPGYDPYLSSLEFSFKVSCPSEFDCKQTIECPPDRYDEPEIDYLAKDYASFRRLMLDRLSVIVPEWTDRNAADSQIALVELLAYAADHLSYFQDAVATEAYPGTARKRVSMRRHARLLDYRMHEGCNARTWLHFSVAQDGDSDGAPLHKGTQIRTEGSDPLVFETMYEIELHAQHNSISFYTWDDAECCLLKGSTKATLLSDNVRPLMLSKGDVLIFEEIRSATTGAVEDADRLHRHAVRLTDVFASTDPLHGTPVVEIQWHDEDALPFPLCLSAKMTIDGATEVRETGIARGNIVLADEGETFTDQDLVPDRVPSTGIYRPHLPKSGLVFAVRLPEGKELANLSAAAFLQQDPGKALPDMTLNDGMEIWHPQDDLLASDRFATDFTVEMENDSNAYLRFGAGVLGKAPLSGAHLKATYRIGNGAQGNAGADKITIAGIPGLTLARNPLPATGGLTPEELEQVRQYAPQAFRVQERAVTEADYAGMAERFSGVQKVVARFRWPGSWYTVFITVDRFGGLPVDDAFREQFLLYINRYRLAGYDIKLCDPVYVPLDLVLSMCVKPGYFRSYVQHALYRVFGNIDMPTGERGFFHPDLYTFGTPVYLSAVINAAMDVAGVASVEVKRFQRWGKTGSGEIQSGIIAPSVTEMIRLDNDPSKPENGKIEFEMRGGI